jgi:serine kinase of HPr protein (carbohydrate metabolism regulator)
MNSMLVHGTTVLVDAVGVLLRGREGAGKSDLALRLIDQGAVLVADDQTRLLLDGGAIMASVPPAIAGLIECRGVGLIKLDYQSPARLGLAIDLVASDQVERLPMPLSVDYFGISTPLLRLDPFTASAVAKVRLAVALLKRDKRPAT